ncbi:hypothetical protein KJ877_05435 [bacterium]|nr:hypothetical protein [bacterium]MBU1990474.1 hypothetical protein [bacterium]
MKYFLTLVLLIHFFTPLQANGIDKLAKNLNLFPGTKAGVQWKRVFSSETRMQKYKIHELPLQTRTKLQSYLVQHAADSEQPIVPGL